MYRSVLPVQLALTLTLSAAAVSQEVISPILKARELPDQVEGTIHRVLALDIDNDCAPDLAYLRDDELFVAANPDAWSWHHTSGEVGITDIAKLDFPCSDPAGDTVIAVGPNGTRLVNYGPNGWRVIALPQWSDVRKIESAAADGGFLLAGINDAEDRIYIGGWAPSLPLATSGTVPITGVRQMVFAAWNAAPPLELVVRTDAGLLVYDLAGNLVTTVAADVVSPIGSIARVRSSATAKDHIAWVTKDPASGGWNLKRLNNGVPVQSELLDFPRIPIGTTPLAIATGDIDGDGDDDLLYQPESTEYLALFPNLGGSFGFDLANYSLLQTGSRNPIEDRTPALLVDMNNDRRTQSDASVVENTADVVLPLESQATFAIYVGLSDLLPGSIPDVDPSLGGGPTQSPASRGSGNNLDYPIVLTEPPRIHGEGLQMLNLQFRRPPEFEFANRLQIVIWRQEHPTIEDITREEHCVFELAPTTTGLIVDVPILHPVHGVYGEFTPDEIYYLGVRFLAMQSSEILKSSPTYLFGVTGDSNRVTRGWRELLHYYIHTISPREEETESIIEIPRAFGAIKKRDLHPPTQFGSMPNPAGSGPH